MWAAMTIGDDDWQIDAITITHGRSDVSGGAIGIDRQQQYPIDPFRRDVAAIDPGIGRNEAQSVPRDDQAGTQPDHFHAFG